MQIEITVKQINRFGPIYYYQEQPRLTKRFLKYSLIAAKPIDVHH